MSDATVAFLQSVLDNAVGPGVKTIQRVQLWDVWSIRPMYNDSDLVGKQTKLFTFKAQDTITGPGFVTGSPVYTASPADTNIDSPGNLPFDMFIHGISVDFINRQLTPGTVGSANDLVFWNAAKAAYLQDTEMRFNVNNNDLDIFPAVEAPAGAGMWAAASQGTTAALTVGASVTANSNGWPSAGNYRNYANEGPFFVPSNSTVYMQATFGNSFVAANTVYKPVSTGTPAIFLKAVLRGFRIWWAQ